MRLPRLVDVCCSCPRALHLPYSVLCDNWQHDQRGKYLLPMQLTEGSLAMKVQYLTKSGLLQAAAPRDTQFVLSCNEPLPDELLTTLQVGHGCPGAVLQLFHCMPLIWTPATMAV
jgi:hypothetical protein